MYVDIIIVVSLWCHVHFITYDASNLVGFPVSSRGAQKQDKLRLNHSTGLRGASRWLGASLIPTSNKDEDILLCLCEKGEFYCVRGAEKM